MMQAIEGIYQNGHIKLLETPKEIRRSRVVVTFLDDDAGNGGNIRSLSDMGEILDDDLEAGSLEIREQFKKAIEKSGEEIQR